MNLLGEYFDRSWKKLRLGEKIDKVEGNEKIYWVLGEHKNIDR